MILPLLQQIEFLSVFLQQQQKQRGKQIGKKGTFLIKLKWAAVNSQMLIRPELVLSLIETHENMK